MVYNNIKLGKYIQLKTGKLDSNASVLNGIYPFFTCSQETFKTNTFSFDTEAVLLGGNNANGIFPLKYFKGKFDAYQRTYVIESLDRNKLNNRYLYYVLIPILEHLRLVSTGATTKFITRGIIENIEIFFPKIDSQQKITTILSNYDNLIENNEKRIKLLEQMAKLIYEEWFVKFKFPGHEKVKMIDSKTEFGKIPEGWEVNKLSEFIDFVRGIEPGSKNYLKKPMDNTLPFLRVGDLGNRDSGIFVDKILVKDKILKEKDIAITLDGTVGIVKMGLNGAYSTGIRKILLREGKYLPLSFIYLLLRSDKIQDTLRAHARGSTILHASSSIDYMLFVLPKENYLKEFETIEDKIFYSILNLSKRNQNLRKTRDFLLPKLISGEVDVSELDIKISEEVVNT